MGSKTIPPIRPATALLVGTEEMLLYTRKAILRKENFAVAVVKPTDVEDHLRNADYDVIIACHTLKPDEAEQIVKAARSKARVPVLITFTRQPPPAPCSHPFDASVWSLASPDAFVTKIREILQARRR